MALGGPAGTGEARLFHGTHVLDDAIAHLKPTDTPEEVLIRAMAIIDANMFIDKVAALKAIITGDAVSIDRKFLTSISFQFYGFLVQCVNDLPRIKDKSDPFYRRLLIVPFDKRFTGKERDYFPPWQRSIGR